MLKKFVFFFLSILLVFVGIVVVTDFVSKYDDQRTETMIPKDDDIGKTDSDVGVVLEDTGDGSHYQFVCNGKVFDVVYTKDNWKVMNSCEITDKSDMYMICEALLAEHKIHGRDYQSYRTASDMVTEWHYHNFVYKFLSDDSKWKTDSKNVDFDPKDQNKSLVEFFEEKTGEPLDKNTLKDFVKDNF